jgi:hypothetical protein
MDGNLLTGGLISGGINLAKGIFGGIQAARATKELKKLKAPTYERPEEIGDLVKLYQERANISQLPGQEAMESRMDANTASSIGAAERVAPSSVAALGAVTDIYGKKQDAIRDLAVTFANYKAQRQGELGGALQTAAGYSDKEFEMNKWLPYQVKMNELMSQKQAGIENLFGGAEGIGATANNLMGTQSYLDIINALQGGGLGGQTTQLNKLTTPAQAAALQANANNAQIPNIFNR